MAADVVCCRAFDQLATFLLAFAAIVRPVLLALYQSCPSCLVEGRREALRASRLLNFLLIPVQPQQHNNKNNKQMATQYVPISRYGVQHLFVQASTMVTYPPLLGGVGHLDAPSRKDLLDFCNFHFCFGGFVREKSLF